MEYFWAFIIISWWDKELMRIDTIKATDEVACEIQRNDFELYFEEQVELSEGSFIYAVGDCQLIVPSPSET